MIDIDSIGLPPVFWMSGDTHLIDIVSIGVSPSVLDGQRHLYARFRLNWGTCQYFKWVGTLI